MDADARRHRLRARRAADGLGLYPQAAAAVPAFRRAAHPRCPGGVPGDRRCGMSIAARDAARHPAPAFLTQGFRPFFLAAGLWSATAIALPSRFDPLTWH